MLTSILPGLREVRTPLAVGYILVAVVYALLFDSFETLARTDPLLGHITQTLANLGTPETIAVITFGAFLIGSTWTEIVIWLTIDAPVKATARLPPRLSRRRHPSRHSRDGWRNRAAIRIYSIVLVLAVFASGEGLQQQRTQRDFLRGLVVRRFAEYYNTVDVFAEFFRRNLAEAELTISDSGPTEQIVESAIRVEQHVNDLLEDTQRLPFHLLGKDQEVWNSWDRLRAEAEFRIATSTALMMLTIVVTVRSSLAWLTLSIAVIALFLLGFKKSRESQRTLHELVATRRVSLTGLDLLNDPSYVYWITPDDRQYIELARKQMEDDMRKNSNDRSVNSQAPEMPSD